MIRKYIFLFLIIVLSCQVVYARPILLNGVEYPENLYNEISEYIRKTCLENALSSFDQTNQNVYEIIVKIYSKVKYDKKLYCPVCKIHYPVSSEYSNNLTDDNYLNTNSHICIDGIPLNASYRLPAECPLCGGIFSKTNFPPEMNTKFYDFWYSIYQGVVRKSNDKWDMYVWGLEWLQLEDLYGIADIYLKASRTNNKNKQKKTYYLTKALQYLTQYIEKQNQSEEKYIGEEILYLQIKKADLYRQLQRYKEAQKILETIQHDCCQEDSYCYVLAEHLLEFINKKDYFPAIQPIGNKLHIAIHENRKIDESIIQLIDTRILNQNNKYGIKPLCQSIIEQNMNYINLLTTTKYLKFYKLNESELDQYKLLLERIGNSEITTRVSNALEQMHKN